MAFFYVKAGGTRTTGGGDGTARTGTWNASASDYYDTLTTCVADPSPPTAGDIICWSDESSDTIPGDTTVTLPEGVHIVVVDNGNQDTVVQATTQLVDNATEDEYQIRGASAASKTSVLDGLYWSMGGTHSGFSRFADSNGSVSYWNCKFHTPQTNYRLVARWAGNFQFTNCEFENSSWRGIDLERGDNVSIYGGSGVFSDRGISFSADAGSTVRAYGWDLSGSATWLGYFYSSAPAKGTIAYHHCKLPTPWVAPHNLTLTPGREIIVVQCDSRYQLYKEDYAGVIDFVTNVYYTAHDTLDDGLTKGSFEFETNSLTSKADPLSLNTVALNNLLSAVNNEAPTKRKVRIRFATASGDTVNDADVCFYVFAPTGNIWERTLTVHRRSLLDAGSPLPTETGNWTGPGLGTQYYYDVDMGSPGNGPVQVVPMVSAADITVYFSWQLEFVA